VTTEIEHPREPGPIRVLEWAEENTSLARVVAELGKLQNQFGLDADAVREAHADARSSVMNLVVVADGQDAVDWAGKVAETMAIHHPSRCVVIWRQREVPASRIDAWIRSYDHEILNSRLIECECISLRVTGEIGQHVPSLIQPLLVADVKTWLWWMGTPLWGDGSLYDTLGVSDGMIVDSAVFSRPFESFLELAKLCAEISETTALTDLQWTRLHPWREMLAQFFSPPERRPFLRGINAVGIDYVGDARGNRGAAALLAGWLATRLGWQLKSAFAGSGGVVVAYLESEHGHRIEVAFRSVPLGGLPDGEVSAVRLQAAAGGRTANLTYERQAGEDGEPSQSVQMQIELGAELLAQTVPVPVQNEVRLLEHLLTAGVRDHNYTASLAFAADLLRKV
jgi:glucose-6-phosphate dehydrogenase assembly protein OpcA